MMIPYGSYQWPFAVFERHVSNLHFNMLFGVLQRKNWSMKHAEDRNACKNGDVLLRVLCNKVTDSCSPTTSLKSRDTAKCRILHTNLLNLIICAESLNPFARLIKGD